MNFKEEIDKMKKEIKETSDSSKSLFREILHDYKIANKRIFIICIIETITIIGMIIGFAVYESQFNAYTETTDIDSGNGIATYLKDSQSGDIDYGKN